MSHSIRISPKIKENESCFREVFKDCADILFHTMELGRGKTVDCFVIYLEVAVSNMILEKSVLGKFINELCKVSGDEILERVEKMHWEFQMRYSWIRQKMWLQEYLPEMPYFL